MTGALPAFFDTMLPFLMGELEPREVTARLGQCPTGEGRLALYQTLIGRERTSVLRLLFPATRRLANHLEPGTWERLEREHLARHRSVSWEPNRVGESFPALVEHHCGARVALEVLAELADYEWLRFLITAESSEQVHFRGYQFDVPSLVDALDKGDASATPGPTPAPSPVVVAIHCSPAGRAAWTRLGAAELAAVARRRDVAAPLQAISATEVDAAEEWLTRRGVLSARPA